MARLAKCKATAKVARRNRPDTNLTLVSMLDILMAILFFLMKIYSGEASDAGVAKDISLPFSTTLLSPVSALKLVVTQEKVLLDEEIVATVVNGKIPQQELWKDGTTITKLAQALKSQKDKALYIQKRNDQASFTGTITLHADKNLKFDVIKKVLYTVGMQDFVMLKLAAVKKSQEVMM